MLYIITEVFNLNRKPQFQELKQSYKTCFIIPCNHIFRVDSYTDKFTIFLCSKYVELQMFRNRGLSRGCIVSHINFKLKNYMKGNVKNTISSHVV